MSIARQYAQSVRERYGAARIFLFGSYARGNFHPDSDIDLAIVFHCCEDGFDREVELAKMTLRIDSRIEPHAFLESDFTPQNPIAYEILKYGREVV